MTEKRKLSQFADGADAFGAARRPLRTVRGPAGRRVVARLAGLAVAGVLVTGCGATDTDDPEETVAAETSEEGGVDAGDDAASDDGGATGSDDAADDAEDTNDDEATDDAEDSDEPTDEADDGDDGADDGSSGMGENLFEGTWGFGHDVKTLSAEELGDVIEDEAAARGPEEMSLTVECTDGIDTAADDTAAECVAIADEGVEHRWDVTALPADSGLDVEVENVG